MTIKEAILVARKQGLIKVDELEVAKKIVEAANKMGYTFEHEVQGWSVLVIDRGE